MKTFILHKYFYYIISILINALNSAVNHTTNNEKFVYSYELIDPGTYTSTSRFIYSFIPIIT